MECAQTDQRTRSRSTSPPLTLPLSPLSTSPTSTSPMSPHYKGLSPRRMCWMQLEVLQGRRRGLRLAPDCPGSWHTAPSLSAHALPLPTGRTQGARRAPGIGRLSWALLRKGGESYYALRHPLGKHPSLSCIKCTSPREGPSLKHKSIIKYFYGRVYFHIFTVNDWL